MLSKTLTEYAVFDGLVWNAIAVSGGGIDI